MRVVFARNAAFEEHRPNCDWVNYLHSVCGTLTATGASTNLGLGML